MIWNAEGCPIFEYKKTAWVNQWNYMHWDMRVNFIIGAFIYNFRFLINIQFIVNVTIYSSILFICVMHGYCAVCNDKGYLHHCFAQFQFIDIIILYKFWYFGFYIFSSKILQIFNSYIYGRLKLVKLPLKWLSRPQNLAMSMEQSILVLHFYIYNIVHFYLKTLCQCNKFQ